MATLDDIISAINQRENHGPRAVGPLTQQAIAQSDAAWEESKHPRGENGKFGSGSASGADEPVTVVHATPERGHRIPEPPKGTFSPAEEKARKEGQAQRVRAGTQFVGDSAVAPAGTPENAPAGEACNSGAGTDALERVLGDCAAFDAKHADCSVADVRSDEHVGFKGMTKKLEGEGKSAESAKKIAASIGFEKYGKAGMEHKAAAAKAHG